MGSNLLMIASWQISVQILQCSICIQRYAGCPAEVSPDLDPCLHVYTLQHMTASNTAGSVISPVMWLFVHDVNAIRYICWNYEFHTTVCINLTLRFLGISHYFPLAVEFARPTFVQCLMFIMENNVAKQALSTYHAHCTCQTSILNRS